LLIEEAGSVYPFEIKSSSTLNADFFKILTYYKNLSDIKESVLLYAGNENQNRSDGIKKDILLLSSQSPNNELFNAS
jgi:hypothetical protein